MQLPLLTLLVPILGSICLSGCNATSEVSGRDIEVLRAVFTESCKRADDKFSVVSSQPANAAERSLPAEWKDSKELNAELQRRSSLNVRWPIAQICDNARMFSHERIEAAFAEDTRVPPGWENFYRTFSGSNGWVRVSLPAFSADGSRAVVYTEANCDLLCGTGSYIELAKKLGSWEITRYETAWIA